jgi:DNA-binding NarL/FixJ family response regulator
MTKLRILLADDHETVREGLKAILNAQADMEVVAEAADGHAAIQHATAFHPDIVIMDVTMPRMNGLRATEELRQCCPGTKVLTLTRHADEGYLQQLLRAGASGYVLKQSRASEILRAIRAMARGDTYVDPQFGREAAVAEGERPEPRGTGVRLTNREEQVLRLVAQGYSNKEIATSLDLSVKTVETHKANAAQKLGVKSRNEIVRLGMLRGWLRET